MGIGRRIATKPGVDAFEIKAGVIGSAGGSPRLQIEEFVTQNYFLHSSN